MEELGAVAELTTFAPEGKTAEWHAMLHVDSHGETFQQQYRRIRQAEAQLLGTEDLAGAKPIYKRYFLSDATNQRPLMEEDSSCTVSYIQQPPLDGSKLALWLYLQRGTEVIPQADRLSSTLVRHNGYEHLWTMGMMTTDGTSYVQTGRLLEDYEQLLADYGMTLEDNIFGNNYISNYANISFHVEKTDIHVIFTHYRSLLFRTLLHQH